jgi:hypothetical protein
MGNELEVKVKQQLGKISFNFDEIKDNLSNMMELYKDAQFTEETSAEAKKEVAALRKIKKALSDRRIEVKKEYMQPYDDFEAKVKELTALIDDPIELIDKQVQVFEEKKKAEKKQKIQDTYNEIVGEMGEYLPLSKIYDAKWENASVSMKSIKDEIEQAVSSTVMAVDTIKGMNSEVVSQALELYRKDLSLANAITYINKHEQMKAEILAKEEARRKEEEERKRRAEEDRIREEERKRVVEEERIRKEARQKAIEEERQRVTEEEKFITESEIKINQVEIPPVIDDLPEEPFEEEAFSDEPFTDEPFDVDQELPFVTVGEIKATFTVVGTFEEVEQVEIYLNSMGLFFERNDA